MHQQHPFKIAAIVAMDDGRAIGFEEGIPWHLPEDQRRFAQLTSGQTVMMGRKTYQSLPDRFRPLPKRKNIVISRNPSVIDAPISVERFSSVDLALKALNVSPNLMQGETLWVIGGGEIYRETLPIVSEIYLTRVKGTYPGDTFFPEFEQSFELMSNDEHAGFSYQLFRRKG